KNSTLAIAAEPAAMPVKPKMPATMDTMAKNSAHFSIRGVPVVGYAFPGGAAASRDAPGRSVGIPSVSRVCLVAGQRCPRFLDARFLGCARAFVTFFGRDIELRLSTRETHLVPGAGRWRLALFQLGLRDLVVASCLGQADIPCIAAEAVAPGFLSIEFAANAMHFGLVLRLEHVRGGCRQEAKGRHGNCDDGGRNSHAVVLSAMSRGVLAAPRRRTRGRSFFPSPGPGAPPHPWRCRTIPGAPRAAARAVRR